MAAQRKGKEKDDKNGDKNGWLARGGRRLSKSNGVEKALGAAATAAATGLWKFGSQAVGRRQKERQQRELAERLARQVGAQLSYGTIISCS